MADKKQLDEFGFEKEEWKQVLEQEFNRIVKTVKELEGTDDPHPEFRILNRACTPLCNDGIRGKREGDNN